MYVPRCPGCAALVPPVLPAACQACGLPLVGDPAFELWEIDNRVQTLQVEIGGLLQRRSALLHELRRSAQPVRHDVPAFAVRNLLLLLGASLLAIASLVFTVVSWGGLGLPAKATILTSLAALALALPWPLARRGLNATAEAVCALGLLLVVLESYAAYSYGLFGDVDARWYTAGASLAIAVGWAAYAWVSPLRLPRPAAVVAAQFPLLLTVVALHPTVAEFASALLATSLVDLLLARRDRVALAAGAVVAIVGLLLATVNGLLVTGDLPAAVRLIPVLLGAALVGAAWAWAVDGRISAAVGIAVIFMVGVPAAAAVPAHLQGLAFAVASALVIVAGWAGPQKFSTGL
ncbi:MAG: hypothetical protein ABIQ26_23855, partial [Streptosporangiaceae bacterium]